MKYANGIKDKLANSISKDIYIDRQFWLDFCIILFLTSLSKNFSIRRIFMNREVFVIENEIDRLKNLLNKMLEYQREDKNRILEISHELDRYIIKYYEATINEIEK